MVTHDEVVAMVHELPGVEETTTYGNRAWGVGKKKIAWDRGFSKADVKRFGDEPVPEGPILAVAVDGLAEKEAVLAAGVPGVFTIAHFEGFAAVLVQLDVIDADDLEELLTDAWLAVVPESVGRAFLDATHDH